MKDPRCYKKATIAQNKLEQSMATFQVHFSGLNDIAIAQNFVGSHLSSTRNESGSTHRDTRAVRRVVIVCVGFGRSDAKKKVNRFCFSVWLANFEISPSYYGWRSHGLNAVNITKLGKLLG